jgi:hypothetical protein
MLQAAYGGYHLNDSSSSSIVTNPVYYEPGFNLMSPLEISSSAADVVYILIRQRANTAGTVFNNPKVDDISVSAVDVTNGESLTVVVSEVVAPSSWVVDDPSGNPPILLTITNQVDTINNSLKVRTINCNVKEILENNFIDFRITVDDDNQYFNYIPVDRKRIVDRNTFSTAGRQGYVQLNSTSDFYMLFSMYAWLKETTKSVADFSYPQDSIFYQKQDTYNNEDFTFGIDGYSHSFIPDQISVMQVPSYDKVGLLLINNMLYEYVSKQTDSVYVDISVRGNLSGVEDIFRVNFYV